MLLAVTKQIRVKLFNHLYTKTFERFERMQELKGRKSHFVKENGRICVLSTFEMFYFDDMFLSNGNPGIANTVSHILKSLYSQRFTCINIVNSYNRQNHIGYIFSSSLVINQCR